MTLTTNLVLMSLFNPLSVVSYLLRKLPIRYCFKLRLELNGINKTFYGYCLLQAAYEAEKLGIKKISAIEFGVGAGNGLIALEEIAQQVTKITKVEIDVYGFDSGKGLPQPKDYRDLSFMWQKGFYKMDKEYLLKRLKKTTSLIIGDVAQTVPQFIKKNIAPIGFVAFDLDYYSSTVSALKIFEINNKKLLPRTFCYFDDLIGDDQEIYSQYTGELLAIREFNQKHQNKKIDLISGLAHKRAIKNTWWYDQVFVLHVFNHANYNNYTYAVKDRQIKLT